MEEEGVLRALRDTDAGDDDEDCLLSEGWTLAEEDGEEEFEDAEAPVPPKSEDSLDPCFGLFHELGGG